MAARVIGVLGGTCIGLGAALLGFQLGGLIGEVGAIVLAMPVAFMFGRRMVREDSMSTLPDWIKVRITTTDVTADALTKALARTQQRPWMARPDPNAVDWFAVLRNAAALAYLLVVIGLVLLWLS